MLFRANGRVVCHETLEDERYVVIKAYKFTVSEILRSLSYIACPRYPYIIESTESTITKLEIWSEHEDRESAEACTYC